MKKRLFLWGGIFVLMAAVFLKACSQTPEDHALAEQQKALLSIKREAIQKQKLVVSPAAGKDREVEILPEYQALYEQNQDLAGWLKIEDTVIDYPVMQTPENEDYYLIYDFYKKENKNGSLILDTDSQAGIGTKQQSYKNGCPPSTNLIIHGHTMKSGKMFGNLMKYADETYGKKHSRLFFDSLYEKREYELIAVFYSQVFYADEDVFKYYKFFQAETEEEFADFYSNIKEMSLYDTGVTAQFGDEFITLSCCDYQVEDGRFVVIGKRI